jgi:hypothetical protein
MPEPFPTAAELARQVADALDRANVPYAIGGAIALAYHAPPRATVDVDLNVFVPPARGLSKVLDVLASVGFVPDDPAMKVVTPKEARAKVEKIVPVDATEIDFGDPGVRYLAVPGTGGREAALVVETANGTTIVLNDLIFNLANRPGFKGWLFKRIGATGDEPHVPSFVKMRLVKDKAALRAQLETWSRLPNLKRVIISHGNIIAGEAPEVLSHIAEDLAA